MTFMLLKKRVSQIFEIYMYKGHVPEFYFVYYELHCFEQSLVLPFLTITGTRNPFSKLNIEGPMTK